MQISMEATLRGGFPVVLSGQACLPEPGAGLKSMRLSDFTIKTRTGRSVGFLKLTKEEVGALHDEMVRHLGWLCDAELA